MVAQSMIAWSSLPSVIAYAVGLKAAKPLAVVDGAGLRYDVMTEEEARRRGIRVRHTVGAS